VNRDPIGEEGFLLPRVRGDMRARRQGLQDSGSLAMYVFVANGPTLTYDLLGLRPATPEEEAMLNEALNILGVKCEFTVEYRSGQSPWRRSVRWSH